VSFLDPDDHTLVLSVVFDGPPEAGKTTSVRALARAFGRPVETPAEHEGRTVFFDRIEHRAGVFEGSPIRLHIVSVPGQKRWAKRRAHFVAEADVVVFVGDTTRGAFEATLERLAEVRRELDAREGPAVGVVFQANKRDRPDAVPIAEVAERVASERIAVLETSAENGVGVREVLVFAVRLALDRVRAGAPLDVALADDPRLAGARELEAMLRAVEASSLDESRTSSIPARGTWPPGAPTRAADEVHDGLVWPPVEGRILLAEATRSGVDLRAPIEGDRVLGLGADWRLHSTADAVFPSMDEGREALVSWARLHTKARNVLSPRRCIVLLETEAARWRLWQIVHREPNLRDLEGGPLAALRLLLRGREACRQSGVELPCTLDTIGARSDGRVHYVGPVPLTPRSVSADAALGELTLELTASLADDTTHAALAGPVADLLAEVRASGETDEIRALLDRHLAAALAGRSREPSA